METIQYNLDRKTAAAVALFDAARIFSVRSGIAGYDRVQGPVCPSDSGMWIENSPM